jgi:protein arginine kinase activator
MKCQKCNKKTASVLIRQVINGKEYEYRFCDLCASEMGLSKQFAFSPEFYTGGGFFSPAFFSGFTPYAGMQGEPKKGAFVTDKQGSLSCGECKSTLEEISKTGRLGCSRCYDAFGEQLVQIFRRIQSGERHRGRTKAQSEESQKISALRKEIEKLHEEIQKAVSVEDYMRAAECKTKILKVTEKMEEINKGISRMSPEAEKGESEA